MYRAVRIFKIMKRTGMLHAFVGFCLFLLAAALVLFLCDPAIKSYGDGIWYCFVACTTIGFGDLCVSTVLGRVVTIILSIYGIFITAMIPGVVVAYYTEYLRIREQQTISVFLEKLEHLPELPPEELEVLSERVKQFNKNKEKK